MVREVVLSARLRALADMVTSGNRVCDVGCDHGFLSIYLVQQGISPQVIAMDVRSGPLSRCAEHVEQYGLEAYIETRLSDGLNKFCAGEAETLVCAGMGGRLMRTILAARPSVTMSFRELILQPQSELMEFRRFLRECGYWIAEENMIEEEGKYYPMMRVIPTGNSLPASEPCFERFGELLLKRAHPVLFRYLQERRELLLQIRDKVAKAGKQEKKQERLVEIDAELKDIQRALSDFY